MTTFDGWETQLYGDVIALPGQLSEDELMHFRTRGSKNGVRRYQTPSGEWTPLGLKERRIREGWGESRAERKAARRVARAERRAARAERRAEKYSARIERKAAKASAKAERIAAEKERRRKNNLSQLTDEEMRKRLERVKMEQEYKELTKSPILKTGERIFNSVLDYKARQAEAKVGLAKATLENNRVKADVIRAKEARKKAVYDSKSAAYNAKQAQSEAKKKMWDTKGGLAKEREAQLINAKTNYRGTTLLGAIGKHANNTAKYRQELRMNPIEAKKHQRTIELTKLQLERDKEKTKQAQAGGGNDENKKKKK